MSEQTPAADTAQAATAAPPSVDLDAFASLMGIDDAPKAAPAPKDPPKAEPQTAAKPGESRSVVPRAKEPIDPLDEADFDEAKLASPAALKAARERLMKARQQQVELTRASHRAHGAAGRREAAVERREAEVEQEKAAVVAYDRAFKANLVDMQSGDAEKFLTAIHRLSNVGDPAGFWRNISLKLASGGTFTEKEKEQAQADPEIQRRLQQIEDAVLGRQKQESDATFNAQVEQAKTRNFDFAAKNEATPRVMAYATDERTSAMVKEDLALIMQEHFDRTKRPLTVAQACETLEENLAVHFELSQRANGHTNRENETTGSGPEAGRATSQEPPKPALSQATIPATLSNSPGGAQRHLSEDELKREQIRQLDAAGFFG